MPSENGLAENVGGGGVDNASRPMKLQHSLEFRIFGASINPFGAECGRNAILVA